MLPRTFAATLATALAVTSVNAHALQTIDLPESSLRAYAATLAGAVGSSQLQQLWKRTRDAGHFGGAQGTAYFTAPMRDIPALVNQTLAQPDELAALKQTQVDYRRDFSPQVVGKAGAAALTAVCLRVDWNALPQSAQPDHGQAMGLVSLLTAKPCR
jgi:hypothetical protein